MSSINGYKLKEPPYKGGMAVVYKGEKGQFTRAFKMIRPDKAANNAKLCEQFLKEIKIQQRLDHPNIIKILDAYPYTNEHNNTVTVLEMEWLDGMDLQRHVEQNCRSGLDVATVKKIALQVISGMKHAHSQSILHLDIKPSNLFLTKAGYVKIIDFGIARLIGENANIVNDANKTVVASKETGESTFKGTLAYASPEQQIGARLRYTSDIYSFGKTLHFISTGSTDPSAEIKDSQLSKIVYKCTAYNPKDRYQTFDEVEEAFVSKQEEEEVKCPHCHSSIRKTAKFCPECGRALQEKPKQEKCPKCGKARNQKDRFCDNCGWDYSKHPTQESSTNTKAIIGYRCSKCGMRTKAYSDGKVNFCNHCGASKDSLTPIYSNYK